jgi:hypothetical protein
MRSVPAVTNPSPTAKYGSKAICGGKSTHTIAAAIPAISGHTLRRMTDHPIAQPLSGRTAG